jgi:hypothetical protein
VRELALEATPAPAPPAVRATLPSLLVDADADADVRIAACHLAAREGDRALVAPLLGVLSKATDEPLLRAAYEAAGKLGAGTARMRAAALRLHQPGMSDVVLSLFGHVVVSSSKHQPHVADGEAARIEAAWLAFIAANEAALAAGESFHPGDPRLRAGLYPKGTAFDLEDGGVWP